MNVILGAELVDAITLKKLRKFGANETHRDWTKTLGLNLYSYSKEQVIELRDLIKPHEKIRGTGVLLKDINTWIQVLESKLPKIRRIKGFEAILTRYFLDVAGHRVFMKDEVYGTAWLCYRITDISYHSEQVHQYSTTPEHVTMDLIYDIFGERFETTITFWQENVYNMNVVEILQREGVFIETKELRENYLKEVERYRSLIPKIGKQMVATGLGGDDIPDNENDRNRHHRRTGRVYPFEDSKVVIDIFNEDDSKEPEQRSHVDLGTSFWRDKKVMRATGKTEEEVKNMYDDDYDRNIEDEESESETLEVEIPIHTKLIVFDLQRQIRLSVHVNYLTDYIYDKNLAEKLVLSKEHKTLIKILIEHKDDGFKDIIVNKSGGAIVLLAGPAGVGKTLTAEVFAESEEKPLYSVQASQLGINPVELEKELMLVLKRGARWKAVLLVDEADVYVHERGNDIRQNAIVGVLLRILEYHASILFLTTNRADIVDDAIASRCVARIDYAYPDIEQQKLIWKILSEQSCIKLSESIIDEFVQKHHEFSGRDIKNLLKLAILKSRAEKSEITLNDIEYVIQYKSTYTGKKEVCK